MIKVLRYILPEFQIIHLLVRLLSGNLKRLPVQQELEQQGEQTDTNNDVATKQKSKSGKGRVLDA